MKRGIIIFSVFVAFALVGGILAHEGHEHKMMGIVAAVDAKRIEVTTKDDHKTIVGLDSETKYFRGESQARVGDVKVGERVAITAVEKGGKMVAREVHLADKK